ncbi:uncharacterized protein RSE6_07283 [Rhynchosporium secalis]|uniref:Uncharacterized protein n=1 Tax=Rhynchosporium secalis TaxID=38038 RepID=A0A1E1MCF0_RHYSE|nr:uncharacterized protein RSE6_07283 [Rhynchosporium secalis]
MLDMDGRLLSVWLPRQILRPFVLSPTNILRNTTISPYRLIVDLRLMTRRCRFPILQEHFSFMLKEDRQRGPKIYEIHTKSLTQNRFCCLGGSQNNFLGWIREMMPNFTTCSHTITNAGNCSSDVPAPTKDVGVPASAECAS